MNFDWHSLSREKHLQDLNECGRKEQKAEGSRQKAVR